MRQLHDASSARRAVCGHGGRLRLRLLRGERSRARSAAGADASPAADTAPPPPVDGAPPPDKDAGEAGTPDEPVDVVGATTDQISLGASHFCALYGSGAVYCWGDNARGQLGVAVTTTESSTPVKVQGLSDAVKIAAGGLETCVIRAGGSIACWGDNSSGQLGVALAKVGPFSAQPNDVEGLPPTKAFGLGTGVYYACATLNDGQTWCWGNDPIAGAAAGTDAGAGAQPLPRRVASAISASEVAAGATHTCATTLTSAGVGQGDVWCWGYNFQGELGKAPTGAAPQAPAPVTNAFGGNSSLALGSVATCAIRAGGVQCWGKGVGGQFGPNLEIATVTPMSIPGWGVNTVKRLVVSPGLTCALRSDGTVECIGNNDTQQLGRAADPGPSSATPAPVQGIAGAEKVAVATETACALRKNAAGKRRVYCWGTNQHGLLGNGAAVLGDGSFVVSAVPVEVALP